MKISVIIPTYNRAALLERTLASVLTQTLPPHEVIVVDDGSTDETAKVLQRFAGRVLTVNQNNGGPARARNCGAAVATGEYLAFVDSDDLWAPWVLEIVATIVARESTSGMTPMVYLAARMFRCEEELLPLFAARTPLAVERFDDLLSARETISVATSRFAGVAREKFLDAGGFWAHRLNSEDTDLALRMGLSGPLVYVGQPVSVAQRYHDGQISVAYQNFYGGMKEVVRREREGAFYPGGRQRVRDRQRWISYHARSCAWHMASACKYRWGWDMYCSVFGWNMQLGRWPFLIAYPVYLVWQVFWRRPERFRGIPWRSRGEEWAA